MKRMALPGLLAATFVVVFVVGFVCRPRRELPSSLAQIDSLKTANASIDARNQILLASVAELSVERDQALRDRDSLKRASDSATAIVRANRAKLPAAGAVPDSNFTEQYAAALHQLDQAIEELGRKDDVIRRDSIAQAQSKAIEDSLTKVIGNLRDENANEVKISSDWMTEYQRQYDQNHRRRCGKKCGIVIGVLVTVGGAIGLQKVQEAVTLSKR